MIYTKKKNVWVKVVYVLDRFGGPKKQLSKHAVKSKIAEMWPTYAPCMNALAYRIKPVLGSFIELDETSSSNHVLKLISEKPIEDHSVVMARWDKMKVNPPLKGGIGGEF